jgi:hypothetical protein
VVEAIQAVGVVDKAAFDMALETLSSRKKLQKLRPSEDVVTGVI